MAPSHLNGGHTTPITWEKSPSKIIRPTRVRGQATRFSWASHISTALQGAQCACARSGSHATPLAALHGRSVMRQTPTACASLTTRQMPTTLWTGTRLDIAPCFADDGVLAGAATQVLRALCHLRAMPQTALPCHLSGASPSAHPTARQLLTNSGRPSALLLPCRTHRLCTTCSDNLATSRMTYPMVARRKTMLKPCVHEHEVRPNLVRIGQWALGSHVYPFTSHLLGARCSLDLREKWLQHIDKSPV